MSTISVNQFLKETITWAKIRNDQFKYYWPVKGGWEGWIQVDLVAHLLAIDNTLEVSREQPIFNNAAQRVDLLLNSDQLAEHQIPVEIKAESFYNRANPFVRGLRNDYHKLEYNLPYAFSNSSRVVLAFPFNQQSLNEVLEIRDIHNHNQPIFSTLYIGEVALCATVYDAGRGWHKPDRSVHVRTGIQLPHRAELVARASGSVKHDFGP